MKRTDVLIAVLAAAAIVAAFLVIVPRVQRTADRPPVACPECGSIDFVKSPGGDWHCLKCPPDVPTSSDWP